jgi:hypothetical protein
MSIIAITYVGVQLLNGPRALEYASELKRWVFTTPTFPFLPSSIEPSAGVPTFTGLLAGLAMAIVIRCALPRKQRLFMLIGVTLITGLLALWGALFTLFTNTAPTFGWLGGVFDASTLWLLSGCTALGIVGEAFLERHPRTMIVAFIAATCNFLGIFAFGHVLMVIMATIIVIAWIFFSLIAIRASGQYPRILWRCVLLLPILIAAGFGLTLTLGPETFRPELQMHTWAETLETFFSQWSFRAGVAIDVFSAEPMLGSGPEAFQHSARFFIKGALPWALWKSGGDALPCDFLRLLAECGMIGTLLLLLPGVAMLGRCAMRWFEFQQSNRRHYSIRYIVILVGSFVGIICTLICSLFGTPLHSPAVISTFLLIFACMGGWMPRPR